MKLCTLHIKERDLKKIKSSNIFSLFKLREILEFLQNGLVHKYYGSKVDELSKHSKQKMEFAKGDLGVQNFLQ